MEDVRLSKVQSAKAVERPMMTLAIYTTELTCKNAHLMPWRTLLEVARCWQKQGVKVFVVSGGLQVGEIILEGVPVIYVLRPKKGAAQATFDNMLSSLGIARLYFPIAPGPVNAWVRGLPRRKGTDLVWYMPGSWYSPQQIWLAARYLKPRVVLTYALQVFWPKKWWIRGLLAEGTKPLITMTEFTADKMAAAGYPREWVTSIPPGKDCLTPSMGSWDRFTQLAQQLAGAPYFLFFGPPNPIRGVVQMIAAFKRFAKESPKGSLICLFRADGNINPMPVRRLVEKAGLQGRLFAIWESVNASELEAFIENSRAVIKPFLIVPSEIPLAVIETMRHGKPVIGYEGDGTGAFLSQFGLSMKYGSVAALSRGMRCLIDDDHMYDKKCNQARQAYVRHPTWDAVARNWQSASGSI